MKEIMENSELEYIGDLSNGIPVYNTLEKSHWEQHSNVTKELLIEALKKFDLNIPQQSQNVYAQAVDMGRAVGKNFCVPINDSDQIFRVRRINRNGETPTILNRQPSDCNKIVVVLKKEENRYILITTYVGELAPMEPWDQSLLETGDDEKISEAKEFWATHALVYDSSVVDFVVLPNGNKMNKTEFEKEYIYNKVKHDFDIPEDSLVLIMGVPGSGKSVKAREIVNKLDGDVISSDDIRDELFGKEITRKGKGIAFSEESKAEVYEEMISRIEENLKIGKFTIGDATFLFRNGEIARKALYELAQKYKRPLRVVILKVPLELAKVQNANRERKVEESVIEEMWIYMNKSYDSIISELKALPDTKIEVIGERKKEKNNIKPDLKDKGDVLLL